METNRWSDFVEYIINKKLYELARASLVPINHEMHSRPYDFLYLLLYIPLIGKD